jgi:lysyl endopeptidase
MSNRWFGKGFAGARRLLSHRLLLTAALLALPVAGLARMYEAPRSFSVSAPLDQVERKVLPAIDTERLLAEDRTRGKNPENPGPARFAVSADVAFNLTNSGTWQDVPDGRLWRLRIQSPGAKSLNLGFTRFDLPEGAKLWVYDPDRSHVEGPYTARNRSPLGRLFTPVIEGDEVVVEVFVPAGAPQPQIEIQKVNQGYRGFAKSSGLTGGGSEGTCEVDVVCPAGDAWRDQIRAVLVYTLNGNADCTGTLMNNTAHDFRPYVLSANHCQVDSSNADTIVAYWNYQSAACGTHGPGSTADNQTGATFRASNAPSDFLLFELNAIPNAAFNVYYAGWDATGTAPASSVGIHHPQTDVKAISGSSSAAQSANWGGGGQCSPGISDSGSLNASGNHWRIDWSTGVTEPGSSGSCIFDAATKRCIGQLHGGPSACGLPGACEHDYYGKLSVSWTGGGTTATRLSDWLDPVGGTLALDGDPHITALNGVHYDFQAAGEFVSLRDPGVLEIQTRQAPVATTFNPGPDPHDGIAACVAINTAVAARVGSHKVSYQPALKTGPEPGSLQLRVDGKLASPGPGGLDLSGGGRIMRTTATGALEMWFPDGSVLFVTPSWWADQSVWFLNVDLTRPPAAAGAILGSLPAGGIAGPISGDDWLPKLPDGSSIGPMPTTVPDRFTALYGKFADAWRITAATSLFDYAPGTSTGTFTRRSWPPRFPPCTFPGAKPARPASEEVATQACRAVADDATHRNCIFDVMVTGNLGFAAAYEAAGRAVAKATRLTVIGSKPRTRPQEQVTFTAMVAPVARTATGKPAGDVQFLLDGARVTGPLSVDANGQAVWRTADLKPGRHLVSVTYAPSQGSEFSLSASAPIQHEVQ